MSSEFSVAATTAALLSRFARALEQSGFDGVVLPVVPESTSSDAPAVHVLLHRVEPSDAALSARPSRAVDRREVQPRVALCLHYLLVFRGDESALVPQQLLGAVVASLGAQPILTSREIETSWSHMFGPHGAEQALSVESDHVRLRIRPLSPTELASIWSTLAPYPCRLSLAVSADVVVIG